ncbi:MAG: CHAD domain-containing protein [Bacteroidota bacterium]
MRPAIASVTGAAFARLDRWMPEAVRHRVTPAYHMQPMPAERYRLRVYDTVTGALTARGCVLVGVDQLDAPAPMSVYWAEAGQVRPVPGLDGVPRHAGEWPAGPWRQRMHRFLGARALLGHHELTGAQAEIKLRNSADKVVARLLVRTAWTVQHPAALGHPATTVLPDHVVIQPLRGYEAEAQHLQKHLAPLLGAPLAPSLVELAWTTVGDRPGLRLPDGPPRLQASMEAGPAAHQALRHAHQRMQAYEPGVQADLDRLCVRDYAVALRQTVTLLRELGSVFPVAILELFRLELEGLHRLLAPVQAADEALALLQTYGADQAPGEVARLEPLRLALEAERGAAHAAVAQALGHARYQHVMRQWAAYLDDPVSEGRPPIVAERLAVEVVRRRAERLATALHKRGRKRGPTEAAWMHALHPRVEPLEDLLAVFARLFKRKAVTRAQCVLAPLVEAAQRYEVAQGLEQRLQGFAVQQANGTPPSTWMALGRLETVLAEQRHEALAQAQEALDSLKPAVFRGWPARSS